MTIFQQIIHHYWDRNDRENPIQEPHFEEHETQDPIGGPEGTTFQDKYQVDEEYNQ